MMATLNSDHAREVVQQQVVVIMVAMAAPPPAPMNLWTFCRCSNCCWTVAMLDMARTVDGGQGEEDVNRPRPDCWTPQLSPPRLTTTAAMAHISPHRRRASTTWSRSGSPDLQPQVRFYPYVVDVVCPLSTVHCPLLRWCHVLHYAHASLTTFIYLFIYLLLFCNTHIYIITSLCPLPGLPATYTY